jgi:hypothetical protein
VGRQQPAPALRRRGRPAGLVPPSHGRQNRGPFPAGRSLLLGTIHVKRVANKVGTI